MTKNEFVIEKKGVKLSVAIAERFPQMQYATLRKLFRKGDVRVNDAKVFSDGFVNAGDQITVFYDDTLQKPTILYEDKKIAVFYKPAKIASVGENSFESRVLLDYPTYICCHRLDTNTDGLIVFAKDEQSFSAIKDAFKAHRIEKRYLAFVFGKVKEAKESVCYLKKDDRIGVVRVYDKEVRGSAKIVTKFAPLKVYSDATALDVEIVTGKTHQIRAHLSHLGYPIIGDPKYGDNEKNRLYNKSYQMLTAYKLVFHTEKGYLADLNGVSVEVAVSDRLDRFDLSQRK